MLKTQSQGPEPAEDADRILALLDGDRDETDIFVARNPALKGAQRHDDDVILVGAHRRLALGFEEADDLA